jgi:putative photosynthetic complex assembly protein 2
LQLTLTAIVYSTFLWWFSTGVIFYLNARPPSTFRWSMLGGSILLLPAIYGIWASAASETILAAYIAFSCGVLIWGWHTMSYYMGVVTGPNSQPCPPDARGFKRFMLAAATGIYHELAIVATVAILAWLTWGQPNQFGLWTFVLLWGMHVSAKLNVFLGIRNLNIEFIPGRLRYLTSYFRQKPMNLLFPFSVTAGTLVTVFLIQQAVAAAGNPFLMISYVLIASLSALAVIEHWFMILPIPAETLWRWSLTASETPPPSRASASSPGSGSRPTTGGEDPITSLADH